MQFVVNCEITTIKKERKGESMHFSIKPPKDWNGKFPVTKAEFPNKVGRFTVRIKDEMSWLHTNEIATYMRNRGGDDRPKVGSTTVRSVREDYHPWSFGGIIVALIDDNLRKQYRLKPESKALMADGHGSSMGLWSRFYDGNLSKEDLDGECFLTICPANEFLRVFTHRNIQSPQSMGQTLGNIDLLYGALIDEHIVPLLSEEAQEYLSKTKLLSQLAYVLEACSRDKDLRYVTVFHARKYTKPRSIQPAGSVHLKLKDADYAKIAEACNFYASAMQILNKDIAESGVATDQVKTINNSGPWFGAILCDHVGGLGQLTKSNSPKILANQMKKHIGALAVLLPCITHGSDASIIGTIDNIYKVLRKH